MLILPKFLWSDWERVRQQRPKDLRLEEEQKRAPHREPCRCTIFSKPDRGRPAGFDCVSLGPTEFKELFRRNFGVLLHPRDLGVLVSPRGRVSLKIQLLSLVLSEMVVESGDRGRRCALRRRWHWH